MGRLEEGSSSSSKRRRPNQATTLSSSSFAPGRNYDCAKTSRPWRKKHLYLALDDWDSGYSIHKLDADSIMDEEPGSGGGEHKLPEPAAIRIASPQHGPMAFTAVGTNIFVATNPRCYKDHAPPTFIYNTETAALTIGPRVNRIRDFSAAMAVGEMLYALTLELHEPLSLQVLSWAPTSIRDHAPWDPDMDWSWKTVPQPPPFSGVDITTFAVHPDGRTIFMSGDLCTYSFDTSSGVWKELGQWVLPFVGQAYFDGDLDAWVGLHKAEDGYVCCCPVVSRSVAATRPPECRMLKEKLFRRNGEERYGRGGRHLGASLTYMGDSRFCLVENVLRGGGGLDSVLRVTLFGLKYDHKGELRTKVRRATRSYAVSKSTSMFSHAAFWM